MVNPEFRHFFIRTHNTDYKIFPTRWVGPSKKSDSFSNVFFKKIFSKKIYTENKIKASPLYGLFEQKGLLHSGLNAPKEKSQWTDINSSPIAISMTTVFILSLVYFVTETYFTLSEYYVGTPPYLWFILIGILGVILTFIMLKDSKLKAFEIGIMSILVGFGIALVSYPVVLRVNQLTDQQGLQIYSYKLVEKGRWMSSSLNQQTPDLIFDLAYSDYWNKFDINTYKNFELRKGGLGFYQVNMDPIYEDQRKYYEGK